MSRPLPEGRALGRVTRPVVALCDVAVGAPLVAATSYLGVLTVAAWAARRERATRGSSAERPTRHFTVLIPAHDEERLIGSALASLARLDYPPELVSVHVVADNCSDATVDITRAHGVEAHERTSPDDPGKGPALQWLFHRLLDRGDALDTVVILDADTTVAPGFLRAIGDEMAGGAEVVQAYYGVRDAERTPVTAFRAAALAARHYLRPLGRTWLGGSAGLYGNGMAFAVKVLLDHSWTNHLTEDLELQLELLRKGTRIAFAPGAAIEAEMPTTTEAARTQHQRWERGRLDLARRYVPMLARQACTPGAARVAAADAAADLLVPPFSILVAGATAWTAASGVRALVGPARRGRVSLGIGVAVLGVQALHVLSALRMVDAPRAVYRSLLKAPSMVAWKLKLWAGTLVRGQDVAWVRTARNAEADQP